MLLQTVRPNIVQSIRAYRVDDLMHAAEGAGQHFLYADLSSAQSKQEVLDKIAESFLFPNHFGKNLDALYDCMTDLVHKAGTQPGFVVVLEQLPDNPRFDPRPASSCSTCFGMPLISGPNAALPSAASIRSPCRMVPMPTHGNAGMRATQRPTSRRPRACRRTGSTRISA